MNSVLSTTIAVLAINIFSSIITDAATQPYLNVSINNHSNCQISDINVDYSSVVNLCLDNKHYECYWTGNDGNHSTVNNNQGNGVIRYDGLLNMMNCYHVNNNCHTSSRLVMFDCNYPRANLTKNDTSNSCILSQNNNNKNNNSTAYLQCKVIFNTNANRIYIAAFVAVIVILVFLFCVCPICCVYYYCRYTFANKDVNHQTNNSNNYETKNYGNASQNKSNKCMKSKIGEKMGWMGWSGSKHSGKTVTSINIKNEKITNDQEIETQPIYNSNQNTGDNDRRVQHEIVV